MAEPTPEPIAAAQALLNQYVCTEPEIAALDIDQNEVRQATLLLVSFADYCNIGICADNSHQGFRALREYLLALDYEVPFVLEEIPEKNEPVYIKFNARNSTYYQERYTGAYRGVLISCLSDQHEQINGTYGHLPLALFMGES
ncbi:protein of unknown function DUF1824 [Thalassoporum mexicanum PCC 7367]|uniref:DUF1824 family protein n=1 Tax=Thalassoporum mexicanum TaxID=3457544 RepID=UPI00029FA600|nr:DUF1824 family protein [Pseudanabaena sp. PCC 7367]AFY70153.1 protein of unknown function DUF1824 [Pseudanabaena sp. PCC 7367]